MSKNLIKKRIDVLPESIELVSFGGPSQEDNKQNIKEAEETIESLTINLSHLRIKCS